MASLELQLPDVKAQVSAPRARSLNFSPETFGSGVGNVIEQMGRNVNADIRASVALQRKEDSRKANTAYNRAVAELGALEDEYSRSQLDEAEKQFESLQKRRDEIRNKYAGGLSNEQAALFDEDWGNAAIRFDSRAQSHRAKQLELLDIENAEGKMVSFAIEAARSGGDPEKLAQLNHDFDVTAAKLAADRGIPAGSDADIAFRIEHKGKLHAGVISGMLAKDNIGAAQQYLEAYGEEIDPSVHARVSDEIRAAAKRAEAEREAALPFALSDQFYGDDKPEHQAVAELRAFAEANGMKRTTYRAALADLRGQYSDLTARTKAENEQLYTSLVYSGQPIAQTLRTKEGQQAYALLKQRDPEMADKVMATAEKREVLPLLEQERELNGIRALYNTDPDAAYRTVIENPTGLNGLNDANKKLAVDIVSGRDPKPVDFAVKTANEWLSRDFGKDGTHRSMDDGEKAFIREDLQRWESDLYRSGQLKDGQKPTVEMVEAKYKQLVTKVVDTRMGGTVTMARMVGAGGRAVSPFHFKDIEGARKRLRTAIIDSLDGNDRAASEAAYILSDPDKSSALLALYEEDRDAFAVEVAKIVEARAEVLADDEMGTVSRLKKDGKLIGDLIDRYDEE